MIQLPTHHIDAPVLMDHASGALSPSEDLLIATHLALCPKCREEYLALETLGGAALDSIEACKMSEGALDGALALLDRPVTKPKAVAEAPLLAGIPEPLSGIVGTSFDKISWSGIGGVEIHPLELGDESRKTYLMRIAGGARMPKHSHRGSEMTLVLEGGFSDRYGTYGRGDFCLMDDQHSHVPVADPEGCICLITTESPLRMGGVISGLVARWFGV